MTIGQNPTCARCARSVNRTILIACLSLGVLARTAMAGPLGDANAGLDALNAGNDAEAVRLFTRALASRKLSKSDRELAHIKRAESYAAENEDAKAREDVDAALKLEPGDQEAMQLSIKLPVFFSDTSSGSGQSLDDTLNYILSNVNAFKRIDFTTNWHDGRNNSDSGNQYSFQYNLPERVLPTWTTKCAFVKVVSMYRDGKFLRTTMSSMQFPTISQVEMVTGDEFMNMMASLEGNSWLSASVTPQLFAIKTQAQDRLPFLFADRATAVGVAKAIAHAARLCGGMKS